jgi:hypothetical protein
MTIAGFGMSACGTVHGASAVCMSCDGGNSQQPDAGDGG